MTFVWVCFEYETGFLLSSFFFFLFKNLLLMASGFYIGLYFIFYQHRLARLYLQRFSVTFRTGYLFHVQ